MRGVAETRSWPVAMHMPFTQVTPTTRGTADGVRASRCTLENDEALKEALSRDRSMDRHDPA